MSKKPKYNLRKRVRNEEEEEESREQKRRKLEKDLFGSQSDSVSEESSLKECSNDLDSSEQISLDESDLEIDYDIDPSQAFIKEAKIAGETAQEIIKELTKDEPTALKIINTPMSIEEKKDMVQLYEIYKNFEPGTVDHYELRKRIITNLKHLSNINQQERDQVDMAISKIPKIELTNSSFEMKRRVVELQTTDSNKRVLLEMIQNYIENEPIMANTTTNIKDKLSFALTLPYMKRSPPLVREGRTLNDLCVQVMKVLNEELYGMVRVKEQLLAVLVNKFNNPSSRMCVALKGEPGIGKTEICEAFAKAIGRPFERIALGSISDATSLTGSMNWYVGSSPGLVLQALRRFQVCDGVILYDEIDKIAQKDKSIENAMKDITDYTKNNTFRDSYLLDLTHDISEMWTFFTLNNEEHIDPILKNRLTIISVPSYTTEDLIKITSDYLLPKALRNLGLPTTKYTITQDGCMAIMESARDKSVRQIDATLREILSKIATIKGVRLSDGTLGDLKLSYYTPSKDLFGNEHTVIDRSVVINLITKESTEASRWKSMYS